ncbi:DNA-binding protein [Burkholderia cepacia]|uniref:DNA-binding protein n=1 Tax=Burkholderia cepacia TaxID=292 RepID=A0AAX2RMY9_BURCE|nr:DNA-binding protein [Burkholderia cepacia]TES65643.1 DNA-binding protein [Burkholderia cepacia]TET01701.1 DNA-binding protein [Burkholderia cepacia]TEU47559.1 DNA-binding protein [Burkholderia cepacia]TEU53431.1 DNA-binding protein [Burkholderia cepacia]TEV02192.1 DNA-binding protein [Burkholderia cepacia]
MIDSTNKQYVPNDTEMDKPDLIEKYQAMRDGGSNRAELSRQACADLFAMGEMPTAKLVRDLTGIGSLSDITRDIQEFWQGVRTQMHRRMKADLPESVLDLAGKLATDMFDHALVRAEERFEHDRATWSARIAQAETALDVERTALATSAEVKAALSNELQTTRSDLSEARERLAALHAEHQSALDARVELETRIEHLTARVAELEGTIDELHRTAERVAIEFADRLRQADSEAQARIRPLMVELDAYRTSEREWKQQRVDFDRRQFESLELLARTKGERDALQSTNDRLVQEVGSLSRALATAEHAAKSAGLTEANKSAIARAYLETKDDALLVCLGGAYLPDLAEQACPSCAQHALAFEKAGDEFTVHCGECEWESESARSPLQALSTCLGVSTRRK